MSCPCDEWIHPPALKIAPGLSAIPRQIAGFPEFRRAMLAALPKIWVLRRQNLKDPTGLAIWRPGGNDSDLGLMLLEMWAYVCDALAFYDEVIAHECYLRTARRRPSLRRLVGLLGYIPQPAVAASVRLAVLAEGRKAIMLPRGTAFRSGAFDDESPQVFELDADTQVHPLNTRFTLKRLRPASIGEGSKTYSTDHLLLKPATVRLKTGDVVLIRPGGNTATNWVRTVKSLTAVDAPDEERYTKVEFDSSIDFAGTTKPSEITLARPNQTASLWTLPVVSPASAKASSQPAEQPNALALDSLYRQIKPGDLLIFSVNSEYQWFTVIGTREKMMWLPPAGPTQVKDGGSKSVTMMPTPTPVPVTEIVMDARGMDLVKKYEDNKTKTVIHYGLIDSGTVTVQARTSLTITDSLQISGTVENAPDHKLPSQFLLQDKNETGVEVAGVLDAKTGKLNPNPGAKWSTPLVAPIEAFGNVVSASRGETVTGEILGSGNASLANQSFKLKKKPLTYLTSPTADNVRGVRNTLKVYVDGVLWTEVASFYNTKSDDRVYIVRQNDDGDFFVTFGDGRHGARLLTGTDNVVAHYRFGAGAATPPAGSITQLGRPVKGIQSVRNPVSAFGGGDADNAKDLRTHAPRSALLLGRVVSFQDVEAVATGYPGVSAARVEWRWHGERQRPVVQIWYVGKAGIEKTLTQTLRNLSDPTVAVDVEQAKAIALRLSLAVEIDPRREDKEVQRSVYQKLTDSKRGMLAPANIGIGRPLYRSHIFEQVLAVPGCLAVTDIQHDGTPFSEIAIHPGSGCYFDLTVQGGALVVNVQEAIGG